ncbi:MAG: phosphatase PAP2 family protein [Bacteroidota bacterium]
MRPKFFTTLFIYTIFFFALASSFPTKLLGQNNLKEYTVGETLISDARTVLSDGKAIVLSPLHFSDNEWITTGAVIGGTILLMTTDENARNLALRNQSNFNDAVSQVGNAYGNALYIAPITVTIYMGGLLLKNEEVRETGLHLVEALGFAGAATSIGKILLGRSRPYTEDGPHKFRPITTATEYTSLPSGHSTVAFAVSSVLSEKIKNPYATVGLYSLASITALSRVYNDQHWLSDTFLGAVVGTFMGVTVSHLHEHSSDQSVSIYPLPYGLRAEITF